MLDGAFIVLKHVFNKSKLSQDESTHVQLGQNWYVRGHNSVVSEIQKYYIISVMKVGFCID